MPPRGKKSAMDDMESETIPNQFVVKSFRHTPPRYLVVSDEGYESWVLEKYKATRFNKAQGMVVGYKEQHIPVGERKEIR